MDTLYALAAGGSDATLERVVQNTKWALTTAVSPSGYFFDMRDHGQFVSSKKNKPFGEHLALTRKNAEGTFFLLQLFGILRERGVTIPEDWNNRALGIVDAQLDTFRRYGQFGMYVNQQTGELVVGGTSSAGIFPATLVHAFRATGDKRYLEAAVQAGDYFYSAFTANGLSMGGPSDAMESFDSESAYSLLESYVTLYEETRDNRWLQRSRAMANQFATWVMAYDYQYPAATTFGRRRIQSSGLVFANVQNKTAAPGICTSSGSALFRLYRLTGDDRYLRVLFQIAGAMPQLVSTDNMPIGNSKQGWIFERGGTSDWLEGIGETEPRTAWPAISLMLTYLQIPGIYVDRDTRKVYVADHVNAVLDSRGDLSIRNPTTYDADVRVLAETGRERAGILKPTAWRQWKLIHVPPMTTVSVSVAMAQPLK
jgi:hypothetical protein